MKESRSFCAKWQEAIFKEELRGKEDFENELKTNSKALDLHYKFLLLGKRLLK